MSKIWPLVLVTLLTACAAPGSSLPATELPVNDTPISVSTSTPTVVWFPPTDTPEVTSTMAVTPTPGVMAELGEVVFRDEFSSPENWTLPSSDRGQVSIGGGEINIVINEPGSYFAAILEKPDLGDFYTEITANPILCTAADEYGFLFRVRGLEQYYRFALTCGGEVRLDRIFPGGSAVLFPWTRSASVPAGAPSVSKLAVLVVDDQIYLYINGDPQYSTANQSLNVGSFGVYARSVGETAVTVSFSNLVVRDVLPK